MKVARIADLILMPVSEPIILVYPVLTLLGVPFAVVGWGWDVSWAKISAVILIAPIGLLFPVRILLLLAVSVIEFLYHSGDEEA